MNTIYMFDSDGVCFLTHTTSNTGRAAELSERNGAASYVVSSDVIDISRARLINGELVSVEPTVPLEIQAVIVRDRRNALLTASDWTDTLSAKTRLGDALYNAWQDYRQILRDIPQQAGFPTNVAWPEPPSPT
jgi:hypothetical protein